MNILIDKTFVKDVNKIKDNKLLQNINDLISSLELVESFSEIPNKKRSRAIKRIFE